MSDIASIIRNAAAQYGLNPDTELKTANIESGMNPNAHNKSGADGLFQFMPKTWEQYGRGGNSRDPAANADAAMRFHQANANHFTAAMGRAPSPGETYLMHQQGAGGAVALLQNPDKLAGQVVPMQNVIQNGGHQNMTGRDFAGLWTSKFDGPGAQSSAGGPTPAAGGAPIQDAQQLSGPPIADTSSASPALSIGPMLASLGAAQHSPLTLPTDDESAYRAKLRKPAQNTAGVAPPVAPDAPQLYA